MRFQVLDTPENRAVLAQYILSKDDRGGPYGSGSYGSKEEREKNHKRFVVERYVISRDDGRGYMTRFHVIDQTQGGRIVASDMTRREAENWARRETYRGAV